MSAACAAVPIWAADAYGFWKVNPAASTDPHPSRESFTVRFEPHTKGEVFTLDRIDQDGRSTTLSTITFYLDSKPRDFQGFGCSGHPIVKSDWTVRQWKSCARATAASGRDSSGGCPRTRRNWFWRLQNSSGRWWPTLERRFGAGEILSGSQVIVYCPIQIRMLLISVIIFAAVLRCESPPQAPEQEFRNHRRSPRNSAAGNCAEEPRQVSRRGRAISIRAPTCQNPTRFGGPSGYCAVLPGNCERRPGPR